MSCYTIRTMKEKEADDCYSEGFQDQGFIEIELEREEMATLKYDT